MPRLRQVPRAEAAPSVLPLYQLLFGDRDPVAEPGTATGTPGDWWPVFALVPDVFDHSVQGFAFDLADLFKVPVIRRFRVNATLLIEGVPRPMEDGPRVCKVALPESGHRLGHT